MATRVIDVLLKSTNSELMGYAAACKVQIAASYNKEQLIFKLCRHLITNKVDLKLIVAESKVSEEDDLKGLQVWLTDNTQKIPVSPVPSGSSGNPFDLAALVNLVKLQVDAMASSSQALNNAVALMPHGGRNLDGFFHRAKALSNLWDGESIAKLEAVTFLKAVEELIAQYNPGWTNIAFALKSCLKGKALCWFTSFESNFSDFQSFRCSFRKHFVPSEYLFRLETEIRSRRQRPSESMLQYFSDLKSSSAKLDIPFSDTELLKFVKTNCLPKFHFLINNIISETCPLEDFLEKARQIEFSEQCEAQMHGKNSRFSQDHRPGLGKHVGAIYNNVVPEQTRPDDGNGKRLSWSRSSVVCFRCKQRGHYARECPFRDACKDCLRRQCICLSRPSENRNENLVFPPSNENSKN